MIRCEISTEHGKAYCSIALSRGEHSKDARYRACVTEMLQGIQGRFRNAGARFTQCIYERIYRLATIKALNCVDGSQCDALVQVLEERYQRLNRIDNAQPS